MNMILNIAKMDKIQLNLKRK